MSHSLLQESGGLWRISRTSAARRYYPAGVTTKYYTHFVTAGSKAQSPGCGREWSGVVELREQLNSTRAHRALRALGAHRFDLVAADIRILPWARVHGGFPWRTSSPSSKARLYQPQA